MDGIYIILVEGRLLPEEQVLRRAIRVRDYIQEQWDMQQQHHYSNKLIFISFLVIEAVMDKRAQHYQLVDGEKHRDPVQDNRLLQ